LGTATLKGVNVQLGVESVEDAMDELNECSKQADTSTQLVGDPLSTSSHRNWRR